MGNDRYCFIFNEEEIHKFYDRVIPPLKQDEVYFMSLSSRVKYLTDKQKKKLNLGRTEMFARSIVRVREWDRFLRTIKKYEVAYGGYTTKNGSIIPDNSIVLYFNINPSSSLRTYKEFNKTMNEYVFELSQCAINKRSTEDIIYKIKKMDVLLMNCYQRNTGTTHLLDLDFDIPQNYYDPIITNFREDLRSNGVQHIVIRTKGGFHILLDRNTLNYNYNDSLSRARTEFIYEYLNRNSSSLLSELSESEELNPTSVKKITGWEIIKNVNGMIPLPGTYQADYPVMVVDYDDWGKENE